MAWTRWRRALVVATLLLGVTGCAQSAGGNTGPAPTPCGIAIAIFGPLSGESADLGRNIHDGAELAVRQFNTNRPDCPVKLVDFDSQADPKRAPAIAQQVVADRQIVGVIGPAFSAESLAASPLLNQAGLASITASATERSLSTRGWRTFHRIVGNDAQQGPAAARYISAVLHARKVFVIDNGDPYGHGLAGQVIGELADVVVQSETVLLQQRDFPDLIAQIRAADPDAIFFGGYYGQAGALVSQLRAGGITATFVAGDGVKDDGFVREAGQAAEGTVITCPCQPPETAGGGFAERYRATFDRAPGTNSAEAYDAASVFLQGIAAGQLRRDQMAAYVDGYSGQGVTTKIQFTGTGELIDSSVTVWAYQVRDGAIVGDQPIL